MAKTTNTTDKSAKTSVKTFVVRTQKGKAIPCSFIDASLQKQYDDFHSIACDVLEDPNNKTKLAETFGTQDRLLVGKETKASCKATWSTKVEKASKVYYAINKLANSLEEFKPFITTK